MTFYGTRNQKGNQQFYVGEDEQNAQAVITFKQVDNNEIDIDHTGVADELGGQGLGKQLVEAVVNYARENNLKSSSHLAHLRKTSLEKMMIIKMFI